MTYLAAVISMFLAFVLASGALNKLLQSERLAISTSLLTGFSVSTGALLSVAAAAIESVAAMLLLVPGWGRVGAFVAFALWALYSLLLWTRKGSEIDCGCTLNSKPQDTRHAIPHALALSGLAMSVAASTEPTNFRPEFILAGVAFFTFYIAGNELLALSTLRRIIGR